MAIKITREEYEKKFGKAPVVSTPAPEKKPEMPILTNPGGGIGTALKDVAVGAGKSIARGGRSLAGMVQGIGQKVLGTDKGIKSIDDKTKEGQQVASQLENKSRGEQVGGILETIGELGTGFVAAKGPQALAKLGQKRAVTKVAKEEAEVLKRVTPDAKDISKTDYKDLLMKGKVEPETLKNPAKYVLSETERKVALKNRHLIDKNPIVTTKNLVGELARKDEAVGQFLRNNNGIFNKGELKNHIMDFMKDVDDIAIDPARIEGLKNTMTDGFLKALKKNDMESLWKARKNFDGSVDKVFSGSPTLQKTIKKQFRNAIQDFISKKTPNGMYKQQMKDMSELYDLFDVVADKAVSQKSRSAIQQWIRENPVKAKIIGYGTPAVVGANVIFGN